MPDLLAHALLAFAAARLAARRWPWLTRPYVTAAMAGAFIPDLTKARILLSSAATSERLGVPFAWEALHTGGAAVLCVLVGAALVTPRQRRRVALALGLGAGTHLLADAMLATPSGRSYPVFWPLTAWEPPTPGLYLSTQPWPTVAAAGLALAVWWWTREPTPDATG